MSLEDENTWDEYTTGGQIGKTSKSTYLPRHLLNYRRILKLLDYEQHSNLSLHLYSAYLIRLKYDKYYSRTFPSRIWSDWPLPPVDPRPFKDTDYISYSAKVRRVPIPAIDKVYTDTDFPKASPLLSLVSNPAFEFVNPSIHEVKEYISGEEEVENCQNNDGNDNSNDDNDNGNDNDSNNGDDNDNSNSDNGVDNNGNGISNSSDNGDEIIDNNYNSQNDYFYDDFQSFIDDSNEPTQVTNLAKARAMLSYEMNAKFQNILHNRIYKSSSLENPIRPMIDPEPKLSEQALSHLLTKVNTLLENLAHTKHGEEGEGKKQMKSHRFKSRRTNWEDVISLNPLTGNTFDRCKRLFWLPLDKFGNSISSQGIIESDQVKTADYQKVRLMDKQDESEDDNDREIANDDLIGTFTIKVPGESSYQHIDELNTVIKLSKKRQLLLRKEKEERRKRKRIIQSDIEKPPSSAYNYDYVRGSYSRPFIIPPPDK